MTKDDLKINTCNTTSLCFYIHSKTPHVVTVLWQDSDDVVTILSFTRNLVEGYKTVYLCHLDSYTVQRFSKVGPRGRGREWATLGVHPLSWLLSNDWLEEVCSTLTKGTFSSRLLLSNQDKGCTPSVAHSLPLPPGFCSTCLVTVYNGYLASSHVVTVQLPTRFLVDKFLHRPHVSDYLITCVFDALFSSHCVGD